MHRCQHGARTKSAYPRNLTPIVRSINRYQDLEEGEDKLTCAGSIDSYVRGSIAA